MYRVQATLESRFAREQYLVVYCCIKIKIINNLLKYASQCITGLHTFCARLSTAIFVTQEHYPTAGYPASSAEWELALSGRISTHGCADTNRVSFSYIIWFLGHVLGHVQGHRASLPASLPMFSQCKLTVSSCFVSDLLFQEIFRHLHAAAAGRNKMA